jgi:hypothetical protein
LQLPKDCCTHLKTPRVADVTYKCGGQYVYFGIKKCLSNAQPYDIFELKVNIDGIQVFKSTDLQIWPILCQVNSSQPMIVALFVGNSKPSSVSVFLSDFVEEIEELKCNGFVSSDCDKPKPVIIKALVCDAPAKSFLKNIKGHNSLNGCERCLAVGSSAVCLFVCLFVCWLLNGTSAQKGH